MAQVWQLLYRSEQAYEMQAADLVKLLFDARAFNREHGITGLLLHRGEYFMQLLEGPRQDVQRLYLKIAEDARHRDTVVEVDAAADCRLFPEWRMGYAKAPEMEGGPALAGVWSERDAVIALRSLAREHVSAGWMMRFLNGEG